MKMENTYTEHWKRASLYLSLGKMYVGMFIDKHQAIEKKMKEVAVNLILGISEYSNK